MVVTSKIAMAKAMDIQKLKSLLAKRRFLGSLDDLDGNVNFVEIEEDIEMDPLEV